MDLSVIDGYRADYELLASSFESIDSSQLLSPVNEFIPSEPSLIADIGAGTGRDANFLISMGHSVVAVEPLVEFREFGKAVHSEDIEWVADFLPDIPELKSRRSKFALVLVTAVWQHLPPKDRLVAFKSIRDILQLGGKLIVSLRNGPGAATRKCYPIDIQDTLKSACDCGFQVVCCRQAHSIQASNRNSGVKWSWLVLEACF